MRPTVIGDREDRRQVVGGMAPFGGEPGVVVIEPADEAADVEGSLDGIELKGGPRHARAVRNHGARHDRTQVPTGKRDNAAPDMRIPGYP